MISIIILLKIKDKKCKIIKTKMEKSSNWYVVDGVQIEKHNQTIWGSNDNWQP